MSICCILCVVSYLFFHLVIVWAGFASRIIQERCFIEGLPAWPYKGIAPPTLIYFWSIFFFWSPPYSLPKWARIKKIYAWNLFCCSKVTFLARDMEGEGCGRAKICFVEFQALGWRFHFVIHYHLVTFTFGWAIFIACKIQVWSFCAVFNWPVARRGVFPLLKRPYF